MSFALPTITLLYLLAPGLIFRRFYFTGEFSAEYFKPAFSDLLFSTILPSLPIHILGYCCAMKWYILDANTLAVLLSGTDDSLAIGKALSNLYTLRLELLLYLLLTCVFAGVIGIVFKSFVRKRKIDRKHRMFRFSNRWHYLLTGEILDYPGFPGRSEEIDLRSVDVLVDTAEGSVLYSGVLKEYLLNKQGGLDSIYLSGVKRRYLRDESTERVYYDLPGDLFVIPFEHIKNIHITYYSVHADKELQSQIDAAVLPP